MTQSTRVRQMSPATASLVQPAMRVGLHIQNRQKTLFMGNVSEDNKRSGAAQSANSERPLSSPDIGGPKMLETILSHDFGLFEPTKSSRPESWLIQLGAQDAIKEDVLAILESRQ